MAAPTLLAEADRATVQNSCGFDAERAQLTEMLTRFASVPATGRGPEPPLFGGPTRPEWGLSQPKHVGHRRRFGV